MRDGPAAEHEPADAAAAKGTRQWYPPGDPERNQENRQRTGNGRREREDGRNEGHEKEGDGGEAGESGEGGGNERSA
jgi:hypothetical protein